MMKIAGKPRLRGTVSLLCFAAVLSVAVMIGGARQGLAQDFKPASPQPDAAALKPGLAVLYFFNFFRHIDELIEWEDYKDGESGPPIERLNFRSGTGDVLTSENDDGVGAKMTGFIHLEKAGTYNFAFESNDGVRLVIDGKTVVEDPDVHADRFSDIGIMTAPEPGWYPITVWYFERKNTSTLRFHWLPPETEGTMPLVPREVLAHLEG
ncbi:MAG TPA: PA14 domain-containing protein [Kiloniellaceae bacterium]|nr:PA14 domain-containing protein [Kiloniellaceae bacterium]